jgi:hypothetical protein
MSSELTAPALGAALLWVAIAAIIVVCLPAPLRPVDYFLAGAIATLIASLAVFATFAKRARIADLFFKRRRREGRSGNSSILGI